MISRQQVSGIQEEREANAARRVCARECSAEWEKTRHDRVSLRSIGYSVIHRIIGGQKFRKTRYKYASNYSVVAIALPLPRSTK